MSVRTDSLRFILSSFIFCSLFWLFCSITRPLGFLSTHGDEGVVPVNTGEAPTQPPPAIVELPADGQTGLQFARPHLANCAALWIPARAMKRALDQIGTKEIERARQI